MSDEVYTNIVGDVVWHHYAGYDYEGDWSHPLADKAKCEICTNPEDQPT